MRVPTTCRRIHYYSVLRTSLCSLHANIGRSSRNWLSSFECDPCIYVGERRTIVIPCRCSVALAVSFNLLTRRPNYLAELLDNKPDGRWRCWVSVRPPAAPTLAPAARFPPVNPPSLTNSSTVRFRSVLYTRCPSDENRFFNIAYITSRKLMRSAYASRSRAVHVRPFTDRSFDVGSRERRSYTMRQ